MKINVNQSLTQVITTLSCICICRYQYSAWHYFALYLDNVLLACMHQRGITATEQTECVAVLRLIECMYSDAAIAARMERHTMFVKHSFMSVRVLYMSVCGRAHVRFLVCMCAYVCVEQLPHRQMFYAHVFTLVRLFSKSACGGRVSLRSMCMFWKLPQSCLCVCAIHLDWSIGSSLRRVDL